jgi:hypothetical protein
MSAVMSIESGEGIGNSICYAPTIGNALFGLDVRRPSWIDLDLLGQRPHIDDRERRTGLAPIRAKRWPMSLSILDSAPDHTSSPFRTSDGHMAHH